MSVAGIDVGGRNVHAVVLQGGDVVARAGAAAGVDRAGSARSVFDDVLGRAGLRREQVEKVLATGSGARRATFADGVIPGGAACARGILELVPSARTIIDVGGEEGRAIRIDERGRVLDFAINDRCAAGTGTFVEAMARALEIPLSEMAEISLESERSISLNAQCAVFGESEVVSLIHRRTPKRDIARAVHDSIAARIGSLARIVGLRRDVVMIGGLARNAGFVESLRREIDMDVTVPEEPDYVGALGAAVAASRAEPEEGG
jgi:benzoyl-CoA reductase subunit D